MGIRFITATMKWISLLLVISPALVFGATYEETRTVVDSAGTKFKCTYKLNYNNAAKFSKAKSSATCTPKKSGKTVTETFNIEKIGKSVTVKHTIKKGKKAVTSIVVEDDVAPTTTAAPAPALDPTHDCTCRMSPDSQGNFLTSVRSAVPAPAGLDLGSLLGGGSSGGNDLVTNLAMQVAEQQLNDFINNGGAEDAITNLVESGQLEEMVTNFVESGQAEEMIGKMMENVDMEQMMDGMVGELEQQMVENMENGELGPLGEMMQSMDSMDMNGGLEELMANMENMEGGLMSPEMLSQLGNMELNMKCACSPVA